MKIGTKSVLFGAHCFFLHPWFVAWAWFKLYGFRRVSIGWNDRINTASVYWGSEAFASLWHPALWMAFLLHDIGYLGKPDMDGPEGEQHPEVGARILGDLFGTAWYRFVRYHSRYLAAKDRQPYSVLCLVDKLAIALTPAWPYLPMVRWTGELAEYMAKAKVFHSSGEAARSGSSIDSESAEKWYADVRAYCLKWVDEHKDMKQDIWTTTDRQAAA
jgi:hypothetical protein